MASKRHRGAEKWRNALSCDKQMEARNEKYTTWSVSSLSEPSGMPRHAFDLSEHNFANTTFARVKKLSSTNEKTKKFAMTLVKSKSMSH